MSILKIKDTDCRDCYKCVRFCPVKAIRIQGGHASIIDERCLGDGGCVRICPQQAKEVRKDWLQVSNWIEQGQQVVVGLAPSYITAFADKEPDEVIGLLYQLGFNRVEETAGWAEDVARAHFQLLNQENKGQIAIPAISSSCPAVVKLITHYFPGLRNHLMPVLSPMTAHGKFTKEKTADSDCRFVFIGPCAAKKEEAEQSDWVDAVLTFTELMEWSTAVSIPEQNKSGLNPKKVDSDRKRTLKIDAEAGKLAAYFPVSGGLFKAVERKMAVEEDKFLSVTGVDNLIDLFNNLERLTGIRLIEAMACEGGCINGAFQETARGIWERKQLFIRRIKNSQRNEKRQFSGTINLTTSFQQEKEKKPLQEPDEKAINEILARTGKFNKEDQFDCGACGYDSCRDKAEAVYFGWAEAEMCLPYMRQRAESLANKVLAAIPNGVIVVDQQLVIQEFNQKAGEIFHKEGLNLTGESLTSLITDISGFARVLAEGGTAKDKFQIEEKVFDRLIFSLGEGLVVGIFVDITERERHIKKLKQLKSETLFKAQDVIEKQMRVAQEIASLLGETTAETKVTLTRLMDLMSGEGELK